MHIRNWVKGEMMELTALLEAISRKEGVESTKIKQMTKMKDDKSTVDKMSSGKFTIKGLFKSPSSKAATTQSILQNISQVEKDIANYDVIKSYLVIYLAEVAIPYFKYQKQKSYVNAMTHFSIEEVSNADKQKECWGDFIGNIKNIKPK